MKKKRDILAFSNFHVRIIERNESGTTLPIERIKKQKAEMKQRNNP